MEQHDRPAFDVTKVEAKLKNVKTLSDLTGHCGVIQEMIKSTVERIISFPIREGLEALVTLWRMISVSAAYVPE